MNGAGWASSDDMHRGQEHGASVNGSWFADSGWLAPEKMASAGCIKNVAGTTYCHWRTR